MAVERQQARPLEVRATEGPTVQGAITFVTPHIFRLRLWLDEEPPRDSPMLVEGAHRKQSCRVSDESDRLELDSDAYFISIGTQVSRVCRETIFGPQSQFGE